MDDLTNRLFRITIETDKTNNVPAYNWSQQNEKFFKGKEIIFDNKIMKNKSVSKPDLINNDIERHYLGECNNKNNQIQFRPRYTPQTSCTSIEKYHGIIPVFNSSNEWKN